MNYCLGSKLQLWQKLCHLVHKGVLYTSPYIFFMLSLTFSFDFKGKSLDFILVCHCIRMGFPYSSKLDLNGNLLTCRPFKICRYAERDNGNRKAVISTESALDTLGRYQCMRDSCFSSLVQ